MNKKLCKKIRKAVYGESSRRNVSSYDNANSGSRVCTQLRGEYRKKKYEVKRKQ